MNAAASLNDPQTWNAYSYVRNNPMNATDPSGMDSVTPFSITTICGLPCFNIGSTYSLDWLFGDGPLNPNRFRLLGTDPLSGYSAGKSAPTPAGQEQQPAKSCPSVPAHPANYPPQVLYDFGVNSSNSLSDNLSPDLAKTLAYAGLVAPNQPFDFKNQPSPGANPQYRAYGNFAFGVFGYSLGFSSTYIKWGAGVASYTNMLFHGKIPKQSWGTRVTGTPYGDNPQEQQEIQAGYRWAQMHAAGKC